MTAVRLLVLAALACALNSCATAVRYAPPDRPAFTLAIWLEKKPLLNPADALAGCSEWLAKGVVCRLAPSRAKADVIVEVDESTCDITADQTYVLARAYKEGRIEFVADCFGKRRDYDRAKFRAVITHELGHVIGIWEHVPRKCRGAWRHPSGRPICGVAVMNPQYEEDITFITVIDGLAFDVRDQRHSRLKPLHFPPTTKPKTAGGELPTCVYLGR